MREEYSLSLRLTFPTHSEVAGIMKKLGIMLLVVTSLGVLFLTMNAPLVLEIFQSLATSVQWSLSVAAESAK